MKKILWLASWYPNKLEPLSGDFIERHARSASLVNDITVIHVVKDYLNQNSAKKLIEHTRYNATLTTTIAYYKSSSSFGFVSSFISVIRSFLLQKKLIDSYIRQQGRPDIINVHIGYKAGLGGLYCKWRYNIPYIISEQWTIMCPEASPNFNDQPFAVRWLMKMIYKNSVACSSVSQYLAASIADRFEIQMPSRIPNVVDNTLFYPSDKKNDIFTFVHVSVLNYQKSPFEIIDAISILRDKSTVPFRIIIYGPPIKAVSERIHSKNLNDVVDYRSEVVQNVLAEQVRKCHSLLFYSRFETFGCVVIEGMAAGLPVVVSDIPVMRELIKEGVTGTFVPVDQPEKLAERMLWMIHNHHLFDPVKITAESKSYSFEKVGKMFDELYNLPPRG